jgi:condensin complex subunit 2
LLSNQTATKAKTLEDNVAQLNKKPDSQYAVDPLFNKTKADFDEGGARGLLLNNLPTVGNARVVFDSSDRVVNKEANAGSEKDDGAATRCEQIDISRLKSWSKRFMLILSSLIASNDRSTPSLQTPL